jgi:diaminopimelate epimerase
VASAVLAGTGRTTGTVVVDVPGGRLSVGFDGRTTVLSGPAVVVAIGTLTPEWLAG